MTNEEVSTLKDRLFYASNLVAEAIREIEKIQDEHIGYDPSTANLLKYGHRATRKRTLKDAKDSARGASMALRRAWEILDPVDRSK